MIDREMILDLIDNSGCALDPDFQMQKAQALALVRIGDLLEKLVPTEDATKMTYILQSQWDRPQPPTPAPTGKLG